MLTVPGSNQRFSATDLIVAVDGLKQAISSARRIYSSLPDIKKEKNLARSTFERKFNMPQKKGTQGNMRNINNALVDGVVVSSTPGQKNRSQTSSYALGISNGGRRGNPGQKRKSNVPRSPYLDSISVCFRGNTQLLNGGAGFGLAVPMAVDTPSITDLSSYVPQLTAMGGVFREFRITRLDIDFIPRLGSTSAGVIAVCVDRDPRAGTVVSTAAIIRKDPYLEVDIKQAGSLTWRPIDIEDKRWRYTTDGSRPIEFLSQGTIIVYSSNQEAAGVNIGELFFNVWVEFAIPV